MPIIHSSQSGQALVTLIVFTAVASIIMVGALAVSLETSKGTGATVLGQDTLSIAESAGNNAVLRLLRDPNYTGETMTIGDGSAVISISGTSTKTITVQAAQGNFRRTIQVVGSFTNNVFTVTSWSEI